MKGAGIGAYEDTSARAPQSSRPRVNLRAAVEAGLGAGIIFLLLELLTAALGAGTPLGPASLTLREVLRVEAGPMTSGLALAVVFVHFALALITTFALAFFIHRWILRLSIVAGIVYGLLLYALNFILFALVLPGLAAEGDVFMMIGYALYGGAAAWLYAVRRPESIDQAVPSRVVIAFLVVVALVLSFLIGGQLLGT